MIQQEDGGEDAGGRPGRPPPARVVHSGCDGVYLGYNPLALGGRNRGAAQHLRGMTGGTRPGRVIGEWRIGHQAHAVQYLGIKNGKHEIAVMNTAAVQPFLISARVAMVGRYAFGQSSVHVHPALIHRLGVQGALESGRGWVNHLLLCLPSPAAVAGCEWVTRIDQATDVMVAEDGPDDLGIWPHEQVTSPYKHPGPYWETGWEVGLSGRLKGRLRVAVVCYDKLQERRGTPEGRTRHDGPARVREYVAGLSVSCLRVDDDGLVTQDDQPVRIWRVEVRLHREYLGEQRARNADEVLSLMPILVSRICRETVMRERRPPKYMVYRSNPVIPLWRLVQQANAE